MAEPNLFPTPDVKLPDHYVHGPVNAQIDYWRRRATSAEQRAMRLEEEIALLKSRARP
jgi:hypothetical protein